jgi:hypothetical protein
MASAGSGIDTSQTDQSISQTPPQQRKIKGIDIRKADFNPFGDYKNSSKRPGAKCKHCKHEIPHVKATSENLNKHILKECTAVPKDDKEYWFEHYSSKQASSTAGEQAVLTGVKRKSHQLDMYIRRALPSKDWQLTAAEQEEVSYHMLRFAVTANLGFRQFNNPHLHAALNKLSTAACTGAAAHDYSEPLRAHSTGPNSDAATDAAGTSAAAAAIAHIITSVVLLCQLLVLHVGLFPVLLQCLIALLPL